MYVLSRTKSDQTQRFKIYQIFVSIKLKEKSYFQPSSVLADL